MLLGRPVPSSGVSCSDFLSAGSVEPSHRVSGTFQSTPSRSRWRIISVTETLRFAASWARRSQIYFVAKYVKVLSAG
jgi:hypothetical protein